MIGGVAAFAITALGGNVLAAPSEPPKPAPDKCSKFKKDSADWKKCKGISLTDDESRYELGYSQATTGDYANAVVTLKSVSNARDPRVLTMLGFATRKLGQVDEALGYYTLALSINPNLTNARQYMGEAYLQKNEPSKAKEQLAEIGKRCGTGCEDYRTLADEIAKFEQSKS